MRFRFGEFHNAIVFVCVLIVIICVPIPLASNRPFAWFSLETFIYGTLAFWALGQFIYNQPGNISKPAATILIVLVTWMVLILLQTIQLPEGVVQALNPLVYSHQKDLALITVKGSTTLSIDPSNTYNEMLKYGSYVGLLCLTVASVTTRRRLLWIVWVIIGVGAAEAAFGIYSRVTDYVIFPEIEPRLRIGTFVNENHYANMLTMILGLVLGVITWLVNTGYKRKISRDSSDADMHRSAAFFLIGVAIVMVAGIFVSGSRGPIVFFGIGFLIMVIVAAPVRHRAVGELIIAPVAVLSVVASVWFVGVGAGNYQWVFPIFKDQTLSFHIYDHAHNDYLQTAIEQGIPVAVLLCLAVLLIIRELYKGYRYRRNPLVRGVLFGCLSSVIYMLLHAMVEFNFRIPANAVYFFAISGIGLAACRIDRRGGRRHSSERRT